MLINSGAKRWNFCTAKLSVVFFHLFLTHFIDFTQNFGIYSLAVRRQANFVSFKSHTSASREEEKWRKPRRYFEINFSKNIWRKQSFQYYQSNKFNNYNYFNDKNLIMWIEQYDFLNASQYRFFRYPFRWISGEIFILSLAILL